MIELQYLATEFNKLLGTSDFLVYLNTNKTPDDTNPKTICTLVGTRLPFAIADADAETINVTITCDLIVSDTETRDMRLSMIKGILGWQSFQITTPEGETYNCDSFLEQQPPLSPRVDSGIMIQQIVVTGTCLVANATSGAIVSNRVNTFIDDEEITLVSGTPSLQKGTDDNFNLSGTSTLTEMDEISRAVTAEYTVLYRGKDIDNAFIKIIEGNTASLNQIYTVRRVYPGFEVEKSMKLTGGSIVHQAGAYLIYRINLQQVED